MQRRAFFARRQAFVQTDLKLRKNAHFPYFDSVIEEP
jgi:hypothetical protein